MEPATHLSYEEYLAVERKSEVKHEFFDGVAVAMSGGSIEHSRLAATVTYVLQRELQGSGCRVFSADGRVRIESTNSAHYPDVSVVCGDVERASSDAQGIANPRVLVEVLSDSTERSDRGAKFANYKHLSSLQEYVLVSQDRPRVEVFRRQDKGWLLVEFGVGDEVFLESLDVEFEVDELYRDAVPDD